MTEPLPVTETLMPKFPPAPGRVVAGALLQEPAPEQANTNALPFADAKSVAPTTSVPPLAESATDFPKRSPGATPVSSPVAALGN